MRKVAQKKEKEEWPERKERRASWSWEEVAVPSVRPRHTSSSGSVTNLGREQGAKNEE